jgi:PAS domain-containing protein
MPKMRPRNQKKLKHAAITRISGRPAKPAPKLSGGGRRAAAEIGEIVRKRAEAEAAIADARRSHERLREAIDILPQGIIFLDPEGRYILWNKKYSEIYNRSSDQFKPGARLQDTIRVGVARGDPYADSAVRLARVARSQKPPCEQLSRQRCRVHRIPSRVRDDSRSAPLAGKGRGELVELICPTEKAKYFCKWGWTAFC